MRQFLLAVGVAGMSFASAFGFTSVVNETFESYADDTAFRTVWVPTIGNGSAPANAADITSSIVVNDGTKYPGIQGNAIDHIGATVSSPGMVNQYLPALGGPVPGSAVIPTATQAVFLSADLFDNSTGNERMSVGLRNRTIPANIIEMGLYNSNSCDPTLCSGIAPQDAVSTDPGFYLGTSYGYRLQLFQSISPPLLVQPDWQYDKLPIELDRQIGQTPPNGIVNTADIGPGWHRHMVIITPTSVTIAIDLFRDGLRNTSKDPDLITGIRPGTPGVDAVITYPVNIDPAGFDSLRIGGPSGLTGNNGLTVLTAFDNIVLQLVDMNTDANGNHVVDAADYTIWRDNYGRTGSGTAANGDASGDTNVDIVDFLLWKITFGNPAGSGGLERGNVPEPSTFVLIVSGLAALWATRRRR